MIRDDAWLVVIDHQRIFADPASEWCAPRFEQTAPVVARLTVTAPVGAVVVPTVGSA